MTHINCKKYNNKRLIVHTVDERGTAAQKRDPAIIERENAEKQICLNCTKAKCSGTRECFNKERNKTL